MVDSDFLVDVSEVSAPLDVPCAGVRGGDGPFAVSLDDRTGTTALLDRSTGALWVRDPFGTVSARCWWIPQAGADPVFPSQECAPDGRQRGACGRDAEAPVRWRFSSPGVAVPEFEPTDLAAIDGTALLPSEAGVLRFDLGATADPRADSSEDPSTYLDWFAPIGVADGSIPGRLAIAEQVAVLYDADRGRVRFVRRTDVRSTLDELLASEPTGEDGALAAAGDVAAVASAAHVDVWTDLAGAVARTRRDHRALRAGVRAAVVDPDTQTVYVLVEEGVIALASDGTVGSWPIVGAEGLFLGRPAGAPTVYAWGNDDAGGVIWRLDVDNAASAAHTGARLLGAGTGTVFQEIVLVESGDPPRVRGVIDRRHVDAIPAGAVHLALAAFIESPRDPELLDPQAAIAELSAVGGCATPAPVGLEPEHAVCCAQDARGRVAEAQLAWLDARLRGDRPLAVVLGVNPSSVHVSALCAYVDDPATAALGDALPTATARWANAWDERGVGSAAVFLHSSPYEPTSWWVACPDLWPAGAPPTSCWDQPASGATFTRFYQELAGSPALGRWGEPPEWRLIAGGYGSGIPDEVSWPDVTPALVLPDGAPAEDGLFFGNLGMDPRAPGTIAKEIAPDDARLRPFPVAIHTPADRWDGGGEPVGAQYWPGQTYALEYLYELRSSGLLFQDYVQLVSLGTDWTTAEFRGAEANDVMTHADFALTAHYLVARVLAHRDVSAGRYWTVHLGDLSRIRSKTLASGWVDCDDVGCDETELDRFADQVGEWPAVEWNPRP